MVSMLMIMYNTNNASDIFYSLDRHRTKTVTITPSLVYKNVRTSPEVTGNVYTEMSQTTTHSQENGGGEEEFSHL